MKVLVEAVGCSFGGILTYEMNLLQRWVADWPADDLCVMLGTGDERVVGVHAYDVTLSRPGVLTRPLAVTRAARRITRSWRPHVVLALRPATTLTRLPVPLAVVVHDAMSCAPTSSQRPARAMRWVSYGRSNALADGFVCISKRTLGDLHSLHPRLRSRPATGRSSRGRPRHQLAAGGRGTSWHLGIHSNTNAEMVLPLGDCSSTTEPSRRQRRV